MIHETRMTLTGGGRLFFDFSRAAFSQLEVETEGRDGVVLHIVLGECLQNGRINKNPGGFRYCKEGDLELKSGQKCYEFPIPPRRLQQNNAYAVRACTPPEAGGKEVAPFRYVEVTGAVGPVTLIRREFFADIRDVESGFLCENKEMEKLWDFCRYSIKATGIFGKYVDGERERVPYEGDSYINQLGHFCCAADYSMAKATIEYFFEYWTWPMEWVLITPVLARDYMLYSGDCETVKKWVPELEKKLLADLTGPDGLVRDGNGVVTIVDWPRCERDDYEFGEANFVPNAVLMDALQAMYDITGNEDYLRRREQTCKTLREKMMTGNGKVVDSIGSSHTALHTVYSAIRSGVLNRDEAAFTAGFFYRKGMACSVFGAQFLLEACYMASCPQMALDFMLSHDRCSWFHMMEKGSTISMEAWDDAIKPNQDWNHAWGAAPANIIPRFFCGIRPTEPGFRRFIVDPQNCGLQFSFKHPTPNGVIELDSSGRLVVPAGTEAVFRGMILPAGCHQLDL